MSLIIFKFWCLFANLCPPICLNPSPPRNALAQNTPLRHCLGQLATNGNVDAQIRLVRRALDVNLGIVKVHLICGHELEQFLRCCIIGWNTIGSNDVNHSPLMSQAWLFWEDQAFDCLQYIEECLRHCVGILGEHCDHVCKHFLLGAGRFAIRRNLNMKLPCRFGIFVLARHSHKLAPCNFCLVLLSSTNLGFSL